MEKRGTLPLKVIVIFLILGVFFILYSLAFFAPQGLIQKAAKQSGVIIQYLPGFGEERPTLEVPITPEIQRSFNSILKVMRESNNVSAPCIAKYDREDLEGYNFAFTQESYGLRVQWENPEKLKGDFDVANNVSICVVAGKNPLRAKNFYCRYLDGCDEGDYSNDYNS